MFLKGLYGLHFDKDPDGGGGGDDPPADPPADPKDDPKDTGSKFTPDQQKEIDRLIGNTRTAERAKAQKEFEGKQAKANEEAEKAKLKADGEFQTLAQKAEKERDEAKTAADLAKAEAKELKLQIAFEDAAEELDVYFANKQAGKDAFKFLDAEIVGEDGAGMKKALEALQKSRSYLFDAGDENPSTDATKKGKHPTKETTSKEKETELVSRFHIRRPR